MSSFTRRIQRAHSDKRKKSSTRIAFGTKIGVTNAKASDLVARQTREVSRA